MATSIDPSHEPTEPEGSLVAELDTRIRVDGTQTVLSVGGEVDAATVERLRSALVDAQRAPRVIVDLSAVTFLDSAGVNALVGAYHRVPPGGELRVVGLRPNVRRVFEITGLLELFAVDPTDEVPPARVDS